MGYPQMEKVFSLISIFTTSKEFSIIENFRELKLECLLNSIKIPDEEILKNRVNLFSARDRIIIDVKLNQSEPISCHEHIEMSVFLSELKNFSEIKDSDSVITLTVTIYKGTSINNEVSLYSLEAIISYLKTKSFSNIMQLFKGVLNDRDYIIFRMQEKIDSFYTNTFYFNSETESPRFYYINRSDRIEKRNEVANFLNASVYSFVPEDFDLIKSPKDDFITLMFSRLSIILSIIFISNISKIENNDTIYSRINGYRLVEKTFTIDDIDVALKAEYLLIYRWVYNEGNLSDKIGLARNVISLQIENGDLTKIGKGTFDSIKSNYEIYLRKNVEQYIEVKNKLSELLIDISKKVSEIVNTFAGAVKRNFIVLLTFYITVVLRALIAGKEAKIFTKEIIYVAHVVMVISVIYLIVSILEIVRDTGRMKVQYSSLKKRYGDILDEKDLNRIFNYDEDRKNDVDFIRNNTIIYCVVWLLVILSGYAVLYFI